MALFVSDLDHTLVHKDYISEEDKAAVNSLISSGYDLCFASGRQEPSMHDALKWVSVPYHTISMNGGNVRTKEGLSIHSVLLSPYLVRDIMKFLDEQEVGHIACTDTKRFTTKWHTRHDEFSSMSGEDVSVLSHEELKLQPIHKMFIYTDSARLEAVQQLLHEKFYSHTSMVRSGREFFDIMPKGTDKFYAVEYLLRHQCYTGPWVAIGDSQNDIEMLRNATFSFSFDYAPKEVRLHAKCIVTSFAEAVSILLDEGISSL